MAQMTSEELARARAERDKARAEWAEEDRRAREYAKAHPRKPDPKLDKLMRDINNAIND